MKRYLFISFVILFGATLSGCSSAASNQSISTNQEQSQGEDIGTIVEFRNGTYNPSEIAIKQYQKVTFVNQSDHDIWPASNIHPTHGIYPEFDPKAPVKPGASWSFIFDKVGKWPFHDHLSPQIVGTVTVEQ